MSERIRDSYDDALYKSTCTLLYITYTPLYTHEFYTVSQKTTLLFLAITST